MRYALPLITLALLLFPASALADAACPVWQAQRDVEAAKRAVSRAEHKLSEARRVLAATKTFSATYGTAVGRWTRLSRRVGWSWPSLPTLMHVIDRESGGHEDAKNPVSSASGLLQLMSIHWAGRGNPFDPHWNLSYGLKLYRGSGWSPWSL